MPSKLRGRLDALDAAIADPPSFAGDRPVDTSVLLAVGAVTRARDELRFDYRRPDRADTDAPDTAAADPDTGTADSDAVDGAPTPRRVQPHHLVGRAGRWYLIARVPARQDWRIYRVDRITPRVPTGPRFTPREVPGGDPASFLAARLKGSTGPDRWPCAGEVIIDLPAPDAIAFALDGVIEPLGPDRCRLQIGSWSWAGLAATLARFDADIDVIDPPELRAVFAVPRDRLFRSRETRTPRLAQPRNRRLTLTQGQGCKLTL